jgi:hypothetical protein
METYTLLSNKNKTQKNKKQKTKTKSKQINKQRQKPKNKKKRGKGYYVTFLDHLILLLLCYIRCNSQYTGYIYIAACYKQQKTPTLAKQVLDHLYISNIVETKT